MKNSIDLIIKLLVKLVVLLFVIFISFVGYVIVFSRQNNIEIDDTISYIKEIGTVISNKTNTISKDSVNILLPDTNANNTQITSKTLNSFYYDQLDDIAKTVYSSLDDNLDNLKNDNFNIDFDTKFNSILNSSDGQEKVEKAFQSALDAFIYDHPELFYLDLTKMSLHIKSSSIATKTTYRVSLVSNNVTSYPSSSFTSKTDVENAINKVQNEKTNIVNSISKESSNYDKALKVHDYLVKNLEYETSLQEENNRNIYGALIEKNVVCEGYAKAFKYLMDELNIECILVSGTATNSSGHSEAHMWNYIKLNDNWYGVDVTWDDPVIIGNTSSKNIIRHNYFCKGKSTFGKTHIPNGQISDTGIRFSIPELSETNYK